MGYSPWDHKELDMTEHTCTNTFLEFQFTNQTRYMHPMFNAALFTIARTWKQPRCQSTDEWIKMLWHMYTMKYYSANKKEQI